MGQFISVATSTEPVVVDIIETMIQHADPGGISTVIQQLNDITEALQPRNADALYSTADLHGAILNALEATRLQANYLFKAIYPDVELANETDYGVVINYYADGDVTLLDNYIRDRLFSWNIDPGVSDIIAKGVYAEIQNCQLTPTATYGQSPNGKLVVNNNVASAIGYVFWSSAFAILSYSNAIGLPQLMVFYGFCAAESNIAILS